MSEEKIKKRPKTKQEETISPEDLAVINKAKTKAAFVASTMEKVLVQAQLAEAEAKNVILSMYIKYGLSSKDSIIEATGKIVRYIEETNGSSHIEPDLQEEIKS